MNNRRRLMMSPSGSFPSETIWVRLDLLKNMITTWDTTIINSQNPISRGTAFPIYAVASKQNISDGYSYANLVWFANDPTLVYTSANGMSDKCRFRLTGIGTIQTYYADEMGTSLTSDSGLTTVGWTSGQTVTAYTSETSTTSMGGMCTYYNAKANECYSLDAFPGNPVYFFRYQYQYNPTNYAVLLDKKDWDAYWNNHILTLDPTNTNLSYTSGSCYTYVYDKGFLITGAQQSDFSLSSSNGIQLGMYDSGSGTLWMTCPQNDGTSGVTRVANITYKGSTAQFTIYQNAQANLTISPTSMSIDATADTISVYAYLNGSTFPYNMSAINITGDYSSISYGNGYVNLTIAENKNLTTVYKTVTFYYNGSTATLNITQAAAYFSISPTSWDIPASGESINVSSWLNGTQLYATNIATSGTGMSVTATNNGYYKRLTASSYHPDNYGIFCENSSWQSGDTITIPGGGSDSNQYTRIRFYANAGASIYVNLSASSENNYDWGAIGKLDSDALQTATASNIRSDSGTLCSAKASGTGSTFASFSNLTAGYHFIPICYAKDISASANNDNAVFQITYANRVSNGLYRTGTETLIYTYNSAQATLTMKQPPYPLSEYNGNGDTDGYYYISEIGGNYYGISKNTWHLLVQIISNTAYPLNDDLYGNPLFYNTVTGSYEDFSSPTTAQLTSAYNSIKQSKYNITTIGSTKYIDKYNMPKPRGYVVSNL